MRIKENIILVITAVMLLCCTSAWADSFTLTDWQFNPYGTGSNVSTLITDINELVFTGWSLKNTDPSEDIAGTGTFKTYGSFSVKDFNDINKGTLDDYGLNSSSGYELTFVLETAGTYSTPSGVTGANELVFTSATLTFYLDTTKDYGTSKGIYGANNGEKIAVFTLFDGYGIFNYQKDYPSITDTIYPDGPIDITFIAEYMATGYWFDGDGNDLATALNDNTQIVFGLTDSNSQDKTGDGTYPTAMLASEFSEITTLVQTGSYPYTSYISSDGSFGLATTPIPEPASLFLFGSGLIGLGFIGRKRFILA